MLNLQLNWPPTINHYWVTCGRKRFIGKKGVEFRTHVKHICSKIEQPLKCPLKVTILAFPPDKRKRDIDNILKALLDALEHANVFLNDNQVADLHVIRQEARKPGSIDITIEPL